MNELEEQMEADYLAKREAAKKNGDLDMDGDLADSLEDKLQGFLGRANAVPSKIAARIGMKRAEDRKKVASRSEKRQKCDQ